MWLKRLLTTFLLALFLSSVHAENVRSQTPEAEAEIRLQPATAEAAVGSTVEIEVHVSNAKNAGAFQFEITFDPTLVEIDSIQLGDFLPSTGRNVSPLGPRTEAGKALYGAFSFGDAAGPDGAGLLAIITLKTLRAGTTPLGLQNVQLLDIAGTRIPTSVIGGSLTVTVATAGGQAAPPDTPVPATDVSTATPTTVLPLAQDTPPADQAPTPANEPPTGASNSVLREWLIVIGVLVLIVALVAVVARYMALPYRRPGP